MLSGTPDKCHFAFPLSKEGYLVVDINYQEQGYLSTIYKTDLRNNFRAEGVKPTACDTANRCSDVWGCNRASGLKAAQVPPYHEPNDKTLHALKDGNVKHEEIQEAVAKFDSSAQTEVLCDLRPFGFDMSGSADLVFEHSTGEKCIGEIKTGSSFVIKLVKHHNSAKVEHAVQAALYAIALGLDSVHIVYYSKESNFIDKTETGEMPEFHYYLDEPFGVWSNLKDEPNFDMTLRELALEEAERLQSVSDLVLDDVVPGRWVKGFGIVDYPLDFGEKGQPWNCSFCSYSALCQQMPTGAVSIDDAPVYVQENWNPRQVISPTPKEAA